MTPAEQLAKKKKRNPRARAERGRRPVVWHTRLREMRTELGLTQRDVGDAVGLSASALLDLEYGADPLLTTALKLAKFFDRRVDQIWNNETESCCECGESYPRIDLTEDGHIYCPKCRTSEKQKAKK